MRKSDELTKPDPDRVEVVRNGSVAKVPLVVAVSSTSAAPAIPYTRQSPRESESESQPVGCLSELVAPVTLPLSPALGQHDPAPALVSSKPAVFDPALIPLMPLMPAPVERTYVVHRLNPDGSCCCGDTGCDGPPVDVLVESVSVCCSTDFPRIPKVMPTSAFEMRTVTSVSCRSPMDEKMAQRADECKKEGKKHNNNRSNNTKYAAGPLLMEGILKGLHASNGRSKSPPGPIPKQVPDHESVLG